MNHIQRIVAFVLAGMVPAAAGAQQPVPRSLVFDGVTVVDVESGALVSNRRVVITGNRILAVGSGPEVPLPKDAEVVDAQGKYLIPGLWDMHAHVWTEDFIARGITGIRQPGQLASGQALRDERQAILAGEKIGPRTIFAGPLINTWPLHGGLEDMVGLGLLREDELPYLEARAEALGGWKQPAAIAVLDSLVITNGRVDSLVTTLKNDGVDFLKLRDMSSARMYFAFAAAARRQGIPFEGHAEEELPMDASDSGARAIDHVPSYGSFLNGPGTLGGSCLARDTARLELCRSIAERFRRNGTWWIPTLAISTDAFRGWWRCTYSKEMLPIHCPADSVGMLSISRRAGMPLMAGTDDGPTLLKELIVFVAEGLTPLEALQTATLNPAKYLRGTDSLGTVAAGKLADLVLLDADPLADITNVAKIRAVVTNGRYFDRAALDRLLPPAQAEAKAEPAP